MDNQESRSILWEKIAADEGVYTDDEIEVIVTKIEEQIPSSLAATFPEGRYNKVLAYYPTYRKKAAEKVEDKDVTVPQKEKKATTSKYKAEAQYTTTVEIADEIMERIKKEVLSPEAYDELCQKGQANIISKLIRKKRSTAELQAKGLLPKEVSLNADILEKVLKPLPDDIESRLVNTEKITNSKANFDRFVAACKANAKAPIYVTDALPAPAGAIVLIGAEKKEQTMNKDELKNFCLFKTAWVINVDEQGSKIGCAAKALKKKKVDETNDNAAEYKTEYSFKFTGDKKAKNDMHNNVFYTQPEKDAKGKVAVTHGSVTLSEDYWFAYKKEKDGAEVTVVYRPRVRIETFPRFALVSGTEEHFEKHFKVKSDTAKIPEEGRARTDAYNAQINFLVDLAAGEAKIDDVDTELKGIIENIRKIRKEGAQAAAADLSDAI